MGRVQPRGDRYRGRAGPGFWRLLRIGWMVGAYAAVRACVRRPGRRIADLLDVHTLAHAKAVTRSQVGMTGCRGWRVVGRPLSFCASREQQDYRPRHLRGALPAPELPELFDLLGVPRGTRMEMKAITTNATRCSVERSKMVFNRRPGGHQAGDRAGGQSSKHRQKPRPRRARRSALTGLVSIPRSRSSRPITSRQTPISSAM